MKTPNVRFNLKFYDQNGNEDVVRTLADLREKCNLSDLYDYFECGTLLQWCTTLGELSIADDLKSLSDESNFKLKVKGLVGILGIDIDEGIVDSFVYTLGKKSSVDKSPETHRVNQVDDYEAIPYIDLMERFPQRSADQCRSIGVVDLQRHFRGILPAVKDLLRCHSAGFLAHIYARLTRCWCYNCEEMDSCVLRDPVLADICVLLWSNGQWRNRARNICGYHVEADYGDSPNFLSIIVDTRRVCAIRINESFNGRLGIDKNCEKLFGWN